MKHLAAVFILGLMTACAARQDATVIADAALAAGMPPERLASGVVCRVGPDGGPLVADRGIGGTGGPPTAQAARRVADRGIGGTGIVGFITGFASICLDGLEVHYDGSASVDIDGATASISALRVGQVAAIQAQGPASELYARTISVRREVAGQIESIEPGSATLMIAGQTVAVPATVWGARRVRLGEWIAVSGMRRADGIVVASRLDSAPDGVFMARGQIVRNGASVSVGNLTLHGAFASNLTNGQFVTVSGSYIAGQEQVRAVASDTLSQSPNEFFGPSVKHLVVQGYVRVAGGVVSLNGLKATAGPRVNARTGSVGVAIVTLERKPDGTYTAVGLSYTDYRGPAIRTLRAGVGAAQAGSSMPPSRDRRTGSLPADDAGAGSPAGGLSPPAGTIDDGDLDMPISQIPPDAAGAVDPSSGSPSREMLASVLEISLAPVMPLTPGPLVTPVQISAVSSGWRASAASSTGPGASARPVQPSAAAANDGSVVETVGPAKPTPAGLPSSQMISGTIPPAGSTIVASASPPTASKAARKVVVRSTMVSNVAASSTITLVTGAAPPVMPAGSGVQTAAAARASSSAALAAKGVKTSSPASGTGGGSIRP